MDYEVLYAKMVEAAEQAPNRRSRRSRPPITAGPDSF